jgi:four helix bundle protein
MNKDTFESLFVWQTARDLFCDLYNDCAIWKDYYLKDQLLRATLSISNNIAE